jgi:hypothetical protein
MWLNYHILCAFPAAQIRKDAVPDLHASLARRDPLTQDVPLRQLRFLLYVVFLLPRDRPITPIKGRCGYFVCVVHFRKLR